MMKKLFILLTLFLMGNSSKAQYDCSFGRYTSKLFQVDTIKDVLYGQNIDISGTTKDLLMDIYTPRGDTATHRPLVILAHGGTFVSGNKIVVDVMTLANELAKRGYVAVSMNYRLGIDVFSPATLQQKFADAYWRGMQDGRAAIRYFRKDRSNANTYKIDTSSIFIGGVSAGGVLSLSVGYIDQVSEIHPIMDTLRLGGLEGNSGNAGYSSMVKGVLNFCGALPNDATVISNNSNVHLLNVHGTNDNTVPYKCDSFYFLNMGVEILCGSYIIDSTAKALNFNSELFTMNNQGHVPWLASGSAFNPNKKYLFDSLESKTEVFLSKIICRNLSQEVPVESPKQIQVRSASGGLILDHIGDRDVDLCIAVYDALGRQQHQTELAKKESKFLAISQPGYYLVLVRTENHQRVHKIIYANQ